MKAIVYTKYGSPDVLQLKEVEKPTPKDNEVIDYTKEDYTISGPYDVIYDTVGKSSYSGCMRMLEPKGIFILGAVFKFSWYLRAMASIFGSKRVILGVAAEHQEDMILLKELAEAGELKPIIDRTYPFEKIAEAHRYVDKGHKKGNVVITVADDYERGSDEILRSQKANRNMHI